MELSYLIDLINYIFLVLLHACIDGGGKVKRFHYMKTEWGFDQLLPLSTFNNPCNGYLVDDTCAFGAEVLVVSNATKRECLSMIKDPTNKTYTWRSKLLYFKKEAGCCHFL